MRFLDRWLLKARFLALILAAGALGVLMAPTPSEASAPFVKITVDATAVNSAWPVTTTNVPLVPVSAANLWPDPACTVGTDATEYNVCYRLVYYGLSVNGTVDKTVYGPTGRQFRLVRAVGTDSALQTPRLLIKDCSGSDCVEKMVLTGLKLEPCLSSDNCSTTASWDAKRVKVTIEYHNIFDVAPNDPTDGTATNSYRNQMSITGVFKKTGTLACSLAATLGCPVDNEMHMWGRGTFCTSSNTTDCPTSPINYKGIKRLDSEAPPIGGGGNSANKDRLTCTTADSPLCKMFFRVANTAASDVRFDKSQQGVDFPAFRCNNGLDPTPKFDPVTNTFGSIPGKKCVPEIFHYIEFKLYGADSVNMDGSPRHSSGNCGTKQAPSCVCTDSTNPNKQCLDNIIDTLTNKEIARVKNDLQKDIPEVIPCDPTICNGTIFNMIKVQPAPSPAVLWFPFIGIGPDVGPFTVGTDTNLADPPFRNAFTGPGGTVRTLAPDYNNLDWPKPPADSPGTDGKFYTVDQIHVFDSFGNEIGPPFVQVHSCSNGDKGPVDILDLRTAYTVLYNIHKSNHPGELCE